MMEKMDEMKDDIEELQGKMDAVATYLKMAFKYAPETYKMMTPEDLMKESQVPMAVR